MDRAQLLLVAPPGPALHLRPHPHLRSAASPTSATPITTLLTTITRRTIPIPTRRTTTRTRRTTITTPTPPRQPYRSQAWMGLDSVPQLSCSSVPPAPTGGTAMTMKRMLETKFPDVHVILNNYPPPFPKRVLSKVIPIVQVGAVATIMAGDQIFPRLGMVPPPWYYSLRANRFGTMATIWLFGNFAQSFLQSSGAFEVYCNGELVFSKLTEQRFPSEFELHDLINSRLPGTIFGRNVRKTLT